MRAFLMFGLLLATPALAQDRLASHCLALAEGPETVQPAKLGEGLDKDHVLIRYLDHASFAIVSDDGLVAVTDYTGYLGTVDLVPDVVTMNNAHSTHWTSDPDPRIPQILKGWGEGSAPAQHRLDLGGMLIRNVTATARNEKINRAQMICGAG